MRFQFYPVFLFLLLSSAITAQDALNMSLVANWDVDTLPATTTNQYNECWGYVDCNGGEYALIGSAAYLHILNLADPTNPQEIASYQGGNTTVWRDMKTYQDRAYSVCDNCSEGLMIVDLSQLPNAAPLSNQTTDFFGRSHNIFIDQGTGKLYAAGTNTISNGLVILDLNDDLDNPVELSQLPLPGGYVHDLYAINDTVYCFHGGGGLYVYDLSDPDTAIVLGSLTEYPESGYNHSGWLTPDHQHMVFCDESFNRGVKMIDVSDPSDIEVTDVFRSSLLAPVDTGSIAHNPLIRGHYAFISYYHDGVQVFDISDPENVEQVAYYDTEPGNTNYQGFTGAWGVYPYLPSGLILGSDMHHGLFILDPQDLDLAEVNWPSLPDNTITINGDPDICEGESVQLALADGDYEYKWYEINNPDPILSSSTLTTSEEGNYYGEVIDAYCLSISDTVTVEVSPVPFSSFIAEDTSACQGESILLNAPSDFSYQWFLNNMPISGANDSSFEATESGNYTLELDQDGCTDISDPVSLTFYEAAVPTLTLTDGVFTVSGSQNYTWFFNDVELTDVSGDIFTPVEEGDYYVVAIDENGCSAISNTVTFLIDSNKERISDLDWDALPNPFNEKLNINWQNLDLIEIQLINGQGIILHQLPGARLHGQQYQLETQNLPAGLYYLVIRAEQGKAVKTILKL